MDNLIRSVKVRVLLTNISVLLTGLLILCYLYIFESVSCLFINILRVTFGLYHIDSVLQVVLLVLIHSIFRDCIPILLDVALHR
jgi:hypothetical protein